MNETVAFTDPSKYRSADYPIDKLFLKRWSPRAMNGKPVSHDQLMTLFEAARWAPSTYNEQEWRFLYATRDSDHWDTFFNLLVEANQKWCHQAAALVVVCSAKNHSRNGKPNPVHSFDAGAAFENLALQGTVMRLVVHGMAGFDRDAARSQLNVPDDFNVEAMIAIGNPGDPEELPEKLRVQPSSRKPLAETVVAGKFNF